MTFSSSAGIPMSKIQLTKGVPYGKRLRLLNRVIQWVRPIEDWPLPEPIIVGLIILIAPFFFLAYFLLFPIAYPRELLSSKATKRAIWQQRRKDFRDDDSL